MEFILIRHGRTLANEKKIYARAQEALSPMGREQILAKKRKMPSLKAKNIVSSPYRRAIDTAKLLLDPNSTLRVNENIREVSFGILEGHRFEDVYKTHREKIEPWIKDPFLYGPEGGESLLEAYRRAENFLEENFEDNTIFISHEGFIRLCLCVAVKNPRAFFSFKIDNGGICKIVRENNIYYIHGVNL